MNRFLRWKPSFQANVDGPSKYFSKSVAAVINGHKRNSNRVDVDVWAQTEGLRHLAAVAQMRFSEKIPNESER